MTIHLMFEKSYLIYSYEDFWKELGIGMKCCSVIKIYKCS